MHFNSTRLLLLVYVFFLFNFVRRKKNMQDDLSDQVDLLETERWTSFEDMYVMLPRRGAPVWVGRLCTGGVVTPQVHLSDLQRWTYWWKRSTCFEEQITKNQKRWTCPNQSTCQTKNFGQVHLPKYPGRPVPGTGGKHRFPRVCMTLCDFVISENSIANRSF